MNQDALDQAAQILWLNWKRGSRVDALPDSCRPAARDEGYAIQTAVVRVSRQKTRGWKIAATSPAGQKHIGVDGPLGGRLLADRVFSSGSRVALGSNVMRVAEAEIAFRLGRSVPPRATPYAPSEVVDAVESLHPAIEIPDSRYNDFARAGAAQLIADNACACWLVVGPPARCDWRMLDLAELPVQAWRNGSIAARGRGANVMGDPRVALAWMANEACTYGGGLQAGEIVTTGTCIVPVDVTSADAIRADFGVLGVVDVLID